MSVLLETSLGDIVIDLYIEECPRTCLNFLKLCKTKYYNFTPFHNVQSGFLVQTGDPLGSGKGGESIWGILKGSRYKYFPAEVHPRLKHEAIGTVSMAVVTDPQRDLSVADVDWSRVVDSYMADSQGRPSEGPLCGSQFLITTGPQLDYLDGKYAVFGYVAEGLHVLERIDRAHCDETGRPFQDIRIRHTIILDDPFPDPPGLTVPGRSPLPTQAQLATVRIADYEEIEDPDEQDESARERAQREREAQTQALTLEMIGDLPHAEIRPPENVLFVCKLNPVTSDEDLEMIFSRFGTIISCQIIRDRKIGTPLGYAFIEFARKEECERAYFKMDNVLIDDRRIKVDFSQSVAKLHHQWVESQVQQRGRRRPGALHADSDRERSPRQRHYHRQRSPRRADRRRSRRSSYDRRLRSRSVSRSPQPHSGRYRSPSRQSPRQRDRHYRTSHRQRR